MNQVSYNIYRLIPFAPVLESDLIVVSSYFAEPIEIINDDEERWKRSVEKDLNQLYEKLDKSTTYLNELMNKIVNKEIGNIESNS